MMSRTSWLTITAVLTVALLAGCSAVSSPDVVENDRTVTVNSCESLPEYDYERMVERVEKIKGMQLKRNVSICVEQSSNGIDTTSSQRQFAYVEESGLSFFELDPEVDERQRSSLGHTQVSTDGGPIQIFLANESVVKNVSWISYEGLVVHELSDAIEIPEEFANKTTTNERRLVPQTTDEVLVQQALGNGVSMYVVDLYVERYEGNLNMSALATSDRNWKHRLVQSAYYTGYHYSEQTDQRTVPKINPPNLTAQILHPNETIRVTEPPARPNLSMNSLEHVQTDRVGELFLRQTLISKGVSSERAVAATDGWANDRMDYYRVNGSNVVTWRVEWQTESDLAEFLSAYGDVYEYSRVDSLHSLTCEESGRHLVTSGKTVTIVSCSS